MSCFQTYLIHFGLPFDYDPIGGNFLVRVDSKHIAILEKSGIDLFFDSSLSHNCYHLCL
jgi:hypothetical protein